MPGLKRAAYWIAIPLILLVVVTGIQGVFKHWKLRSEVETLGASPMGGAHRLDSIQEDAVWRAQVWAVLLLTAGLVFIGIVMFTQNYTIKPRIAPEESPRAPPASPQPQPRPPPNPPPESPNAPIRWFWRVALAVNGVVLTMAIYNGIRGYADYREARDKLDELLPAFEAREAKLKAARVKEDAANKQWQQANENYWLLLARDEAAAKLLAVEVAEKMKLLIEARQARELEATVVDLMSHDVTLYKRLARGSPWRIVTDCTGG